MAHGQNSNSVKFRPSFQFWDHHQDRIQASGQERFSSEAAYQGTTAAWGVFR